MSGALPVDKSTALRRVFGASVLSRERLDRLQVNGEVLPGIVREQLMADFSDDFFPVKPADKTRYRYMHMFPHACRARTDAALLPRCSSLISQPHCVRHTETT